MTDLLFVAGIFSVAMFYASFPLNPKEQDEVRGLFVAAILFRCV